LVVFGAFCSNLWSLSTRQVSTALLRLLSLVLGLYACQYLTAIPYGGVADNTKGNFGSYPIALATRQQARNDACQRSQPVRPIIPAGKTGRSATSSDLFNSATQLAVQLARFMIVTGVIRTTSMCTHVYCVRMSPTPDAETAANLCKWCSTVVLVNGGPLMWSIILCPPAYRIGRISHPVVQHRVRTLNTTHLPIKLKR
jgi:hypothetical protein